MGTRTWTLMNRNTRFWVKCFYPLGNATPPKKTTRSSSKKFEWGINHLSTFFHRLVSWTGPFPSIAARVICGTLNFVMIIRKTLCGFFCAWRWSIIFIYTLHGQCLFIKSTSLPTWLPSIKCVCFYDFYWHHQVAILEVNWWWNNKNAIELYMRTRGRTGLYTRHGMRTCGHFLSWQNIIAQCVFAAIL